MSDQNLIGLRTEWGVMVRYDFSRNGYTRLASSWKTEEEAVANCQALEVSRLQRRQERAHEGREPSPGEGHPFVVFRRVSDWAELEQEAEAA